MPVDFADIGGMGSLPAGWAMARVAEGSADALLTEEVAASQRNHAMPAL